MHKRVAEHFSPYYAYMHMLIRTYMHTQTHTHIQCWSRYFLKVIYYILLVTAVKNNPLQLHITSK